MAIRGNIGISAQDVLTSDTLVVEVSDPVERIAITAASLYNDTVASITVNFFESPNATAASGDKIDQITVGSNSVTPVSSLLGQGYSTAQNIVAVATAAGANFSYTRTEYDAGS